MEAAQKMIVQAIEIYNYERRHKSLNMKTPVQAHKENNHWAAFRQHKFYKKIKSQKAKPGFDSLFFSFFFEKFSYIYSIKTSKNGQPILRFDTNYCDGTSTLWCY